MHTPARTRGGVDTVDAASFMVIVNDVIHRYRIATSLLGLNPAIPPALQALNDDIISIIAACNPRHVIKEAAVTADRLRSIAARCAYDAKLAGRDSMTISMDPVFLAPHVADYVYQEARVTLASTQMPIIDIERSPRGHANRFVRKVSATNGAGSSLSTQLQMIDRIAATRARPMTLIVVEDYVNHGHSLRRNLKRYIEDPDVEVIIIAGLTTDASRDFLSDTIQLETAYEAPNTANLQHMDVSDMIPTLGGRMVGYWQRNFTSTDQEAEIVPWIIGGQDYPVALAVDAVCGKYPWQTDMFSNAASKDSLSRLHTLCRATAIAFWSSLEDKAGRRLTWDRLGPLCGHLRIFYPAVNGHPIQDFKHNFTDSPLQAALSITSTDMTLGFTP